MVRAGVWSPPSVWRWMGGTSCSSHDAVGRRRAALVMGSVVVVGALAIERLHGQVQPRPGRRRAHGGPAVDRAAVDVVPGSVRQHVEQRGPGRQADEARGHAQRQEEVNPATPITVSATNGKLRKVTLVNARASRSRGAYSADTPAGTRPRCSATASPTSWWPRPPRAPTAPVEDDQAQVHHAHPGNMTMPYLDDICGAPLHNGATYGVAMVPVVHFDEPITQQGGGREGAAGHHQPARRRLLVLGRRPERALAPAALLHVRHQGHHQRQRLRRRSRPGALRPVRRAARPSRSAASRSPSPTTPRPSR